MSPQQWRVFVNDKWYGPATAQQLRQLADQGKITRETLVVADGMEKPVAASRVSGLFKQPTEHSPDSTQQRQPPIVHPQPADAQTDLQPKWHKAPAGIFAMCSIGGVLTVIAIAFLSFVLWPSKQPVAKLPDGKLDLLKYQRELQEKDESLKLKGDEIGKLKEETVQLLTIQRSQEAKVLELESQLAQSVEKNINLEKLLADAREAATKNANAIALLTAEEKKRNAGVALAPKTFTFSDPRGAITVEVLGILTGDQIVHNSKMHGFHLADYRKQQKEVIYFDVKVTNNKYDGELTISQYDFKLESADGETFSCTQTTDYIHGDIHSGRSTRGGIAFPYYRNSVPKLLRFDTGLQDGLGTKLESNSPDLQALVPR